MSWRKIWARECEYLHGPKGGNASGRRMPNSNSDPATPTCRVPADKRSAFLNFPIWGEGGGPKPKMRLEAVAKTVQAETTASKGRGERQGRRCLSSPGLETWAHLIYLRTLCALGVSMIRASESC